MTELNITKSNFEAEVMNADKPVLIDFCPPSPKSPKSTVTR